MEYQALRPTEAADTPDAGLGRFPLETKGVGRTQPHDQAANGRHRKRRIAHTQRHCRDGIIVAGGATITTPLEGVAVPKSSTKGRECGNKELEDKNRTMTKQPHGRSVVLRWVSRMPCTPSRQQTKGGQSTPEETESLVTHRVN